MLGAFMIRRPLHSGVRMPLPHWLGSRNHSTPVVQRFTVWHSPRVRAEWVLLRFCRSFSCSFFRWMGSQPGVLPATREHRISQLLWCLGNTNPLKPGHARLKIEHKTHFMVPAIWADADILPGTCKYIYIRGTQKRCFWFWWCCFWW